MGDIWFWLCIVIFIFQVADMILHAKEVKDINFYKNSVIKKLIESNDKLKDKVKVLESINEEIREKNIELESKKIEKEIKPNTTTHIVKEYGKHIEIKGVIADDCFDYDIDKPIPEYVYDCMKKEIGDKIIDDGLVEIRKEVDPVNLKVLIGYKVRIVK